jgi:hypothetical protein
VIGCMGNIIGIQDAGRRLHFEGRPQLSAAAFIKWFW